MLNKKQFGALAATTKTGMPNAKQVNMNGGWSAPAKMKGEVHEYDHKRPMCPVMSRYAK